MRKTKTSINQKKKTHLYPFYPANIPSAFPIYNSSYPVWL